MSFRVEITAEAEGDLDSMAAAGEEVLKGFDREGHEFYSCRFRRSLKFRLQPLRAMGLGGIQDKQSSKDTLVGRLPTFAQPDFGGCSLDDVHSPAHRESCGR